jgi:hypothetical protein
VNGAAAIETTSSPNELQKAVHAAPAGAVASRIGVDISTGVPAREVEERRVHSARIVFPQRRSRT